MRRAGDCSGGTDHRRKGRRSREVIECYDISIHAAGNSSPERLEIIVAELGALEQEVGILAEGGSDDPGDIDQIPFAINRERENRLQLTLPANSKYGNSADVRVLALRPVGELFAPLDAPVIALEISQWIARSGFESPPFAGNRVQTVQGRKLFDLPVTRLACRRVQDNRKAVANSVIFAQRKHA